jgi:hypothetical protein
MSAFYDILKDIGGDCPGEGGSALVSRVIVNLAAPISVGIGVFTGVYAVETMGPLPSVFIGAGVIAALSYYLLLGTACALKGKSFFLCPIAYAIKQIASMFTFGLSDAITKFVDSAADAVLEMTGGCGTDDGAGTPPCAKPAGAAETGKAVDDWLWASIEAAFQSKSKTRAEWAAKCSQEKLTLEQACICKQGRAAGEF